MAIPTSLAIPSEGIKQLREFLIATAALCGASFEFDSDCGYWFATGEFKNKSYRSIACFYKHNAATDWMDEHHIPYAVPA